MNTAKKIYKAMMIVERKDGKSHWMRIGTAFPNRDDSINVYLDAYPKDGKVQIREFDEEDLRRKDGDAPRQRGGARADSGGGPLETEDLPF